MTETQVSSGTTQAPAAPVVSGQVVSVPDQLTPEQVMALAAIAGDITVKIVLAGSTYDLTVKVPTAAGDPYKFLLAEKKKENGEDVTQTLADFNFIDAENFKVAVSIPSFKAAGATISGGFLLKSGSVPGR